MSTEVPAPLLTRLSFLLGKLYFRVLDLESEGLAQLGVGVKQQAVLTLLAADGPMAQQALGQRLGIDRTTIVTVVDGLEQHGYVERRRSPSDRRAYLLTLTNAGEQARQQGMHLVDRAEHELLAALDGSQRSELIDLLARAVTGRPGKDDRPDAAPPGRRR